MKETRGRTSFDAVKAALNGMGAYVCARDVASGDILFVNDSMREHFVLDGGNAEADKARVQLQCSTPHPQDTPEIPEARQEYDALTGRYYESTGRILFK